MPSLLVYVGVQSFHMLCVVMQYQGAAFTIISNVTLPMVVINCRLYQEAICSSSVWPACLLLASMKRSGTHLSRTSLA